MHTLSQRVDLISLLLHFLCLYHILVQVIVEVVQLLKRLAHVLTRSSDLIVILQYLSQIHIPSLIISSSLLYELNKHLLTAVAEHAIVESV